MAKQRSKSKLLSKLGEAGRKAFDAHKNDETNYGAGGDLPAGIEGGIARLVECKFDTYKSGDFEGEPYFYAAGVVVEPKVFDGIRIEGLRTSIMEPLCDTPGRSRETVEDHLAWVLNELRKLGVDTAGLSFEDLDAVVDMLKQAGPYFRFRTWQGTPTEQFPNPRVQHQWRGVCEYAESDGGEADAVEDATGSDEDGADGAENTPSEAETGPDTQSETDLDTLAEQADRGVPEAADRLNELALQAGLTQDQIDAAETWTDVVEMVQNAGADGDEADGDDDAPFEDEADGDEDESPEEWAPEVGEIYLYRPPKARKSIEVEVTKVFAGRKTATVKALDDNRTFKAVPWTELHEG